MTGKAYFFFYCQSVDISYALANKIMDVRYKPYLSNLDDIYYGEGLGSRGDPWNAKLKALQVAVSNWGMQKVKEKLRNL